MRRLLAMMALLSLCGCVERQPPPEPAQKTPITFAYWALNPAETALVNQQVAEFERLNPAVDVTVLEIPNRYYQKLQTMFSAGTPPDVMVLNTGRAGDLARRGVLADLSPFMDGPEGPQAADFLPAAMAHFRQIGPTMGQPGLYALPQDWNPTNLLLYDADAFDAAGLPYPDGNWTWQDFAHACRKLTRTSSDPHRQRYGAAVCLYPYAAVAWFWQAGGEVLDAQGRSMLGAAANTRAVRFIRGLVQEGVVAPPVAAEDRSLEDFQSGRVAMAFVTPYSLGTLRQAEQPRRWALAPPLRDARQATGCISTGLAIAAASPHQPEAWRFLTHMATNGALARTGAALAIPAWNEALNSGALEEGFGEKNAAVLRQAASLARPHPLSSRHSYEEMSDALRTALERVFAAEEEPQKALQQAQETLRARARDE